MITQSYTIILKFFTLHSRPLLMVLIVELLTLISNSIYLNLILEAGSSVSPNRRKSTAAILDLLYKIWKFD